MTMSFREQLGQLLAAHRAFIRAQEHHTRLWDQQLATGSPGAAEVAADYLTVARAEELFEERLKALLDAHPQLSSLLCACNACECGVTPDDDGICSACKVGLHSRKRQVED